MYFVHVGKRYFEKVNSKTFYAITKEKEIDVDKNSLVHQLRCCILIHFSCISKIRVQIRS